MHNCDKKWDEPFEISDDDFTKEELAEIYGLPSNNYISCEDDAIEHELERADAYYNPNVR